MSMGPQGAPTESDMTVAPGATSDRSTASTDGSTGPRAVVRSSANVPVVTDRATRALMAGAHPSAMVSDTGRLFTWLMRTLLRGVVFAPRSIAALKEVESHGPVVYVMQTRSWTDYLYFNIAFEQHGLRPVLFANGVNTWSIRPFWRAVRTLLRGRRGLPRDAESLERIVKAGGTAMLFLQRRGRGPEDRPRFSRVLLQRLAAAQAEMGGTVHVVPLLLVWDKHPDRDEPTLLDEVFGTRQEPGFFRKIGLVAKQTWESFLNLGAPQVQVSEPIDLAALVSERRDDSAAALEETVAERLDAERRIIVGPGVKTARQIRREILTDPRTIAAIGEVSEATGRDVAALQKEAGDALKSIAADFSLFVVKLFSALLGAVFSQIYDGLEVDDDGIDRLRRIARDKRVVLVPSHKSHIDYLVLSYVFYQRGLIPPHIAAGDNLAFWPMGPLFRRAGAFFLRRTFAGDPLYGRVFDAYLVKLLEEGFFLEFFIEGTRSRTGKLNPPKYGMLTMLLNAHRVGGVEDLVFVPVSVGYENVIEGSEYRKELAGGEKRAESLGGLLRTSQVLRSRYGRVYVEIGDEIGAREFIEEFHPEGGRGLSKDEVDRSVRRLAYRIIHEINAVTTVTPSSLAALIVLNNPARGMDREVLTREAGFVLSFLQEKKARFSGSILTATNARFAAIRGTAAAPIDVDDLDEYDRDFVQSRSSEELPSAESVVRRTDLALGDAVIHTLEEALRLLADKGLVEIREVDGEVLFVAPDERRTELAFYKNNIIHYFVDEAVFASAVFVIEGEAVPIDDVRDFARLLSRLLKHEFCFADRGHFDDVFQSTLAYFCDRGWVSCSGDGLVRVADPPPAGAEFVRGLLIPTLESYYLIAMAIPDIADAWVDDRTFARRILARGSAMLVKGELEHGEAIAKSTIQNATRLFQEWGVLERRERDRGRGRRKQWEFRLSEEYRGELIDDLIGDLGALIERQKRRPGEILRRL